jgi:hypothetical protein
MRRLKQGPTEQLRRRKYRLKNHIPLENKQLRRRKYRQKIPQDFKKGGQEEK